MLARFSGGVLSLDEVYRFHNEPVRNDGALQWDILRLWYEIQRSLAKIPRGTLDSMAVDTWGCDFALLGERGNLLENPYHYRDARTDGVMDTVFERLPRERIYAVTGIQFLTFNTLYQLYAACRATPRLIDSARTFLTIADVLNYWLTGRIQSEYTLATTTQFVDARTRSWATELLEALDIPSRLLPPLAEPGSLIGPVRREIAPSCVGATVVAPGCHDTASAVASVELGDGAAFLSSGTWSLLGTEIAAPIINADTRDLNFTNEGGVCGTTRLLKNIGGLWLLQSCRRSWAAAGHQYGYNELMDGATDPKHAFVSLLDPDNGLFFHPEDMVASIAQYCRDTGQPEPSGPPAYARAILESLAFKYRSVLESLERVTGRRISKIRVVGGGVRNRLLNQFTADATGRTVIAGPIEATALGNIAMQMVALGAVGTLSEARAVIERSFPVERFEPIHAEQWEPHYRRFQEYVELTCA